MRGKAGLLLVLMVSLFVVSVGCGGGNNSNAGTTGTYSTATLNGPWIATGWGAYFVADGNGAITEVGQMNSYSPAGTYQVQSNGSCTINFLAGVYDPAWSMSGTFTSSTAGTFTSPGGTETITKVSDLTACQGNWSGTIHETSGGSASHPITFTINSNGAVTASTGYTITSGKMFCESGVVAAFFKTTATQPYDQIMIRGSVSGSSITGTYECNINSLSGTISFTKQ